MAALSADRNTVRRDGDLNSRPVKGGVLIYAGALVCLDTAGRAVPGSAANPVTADGRANFRVDNTLGADGALNVETQAGIFRWDNSAGGDLITAANIGAPAYVVDDHTVALTSNGAARSVAGKIMDVDSVGVWVATGIIFGAAPSTL
jgi:hypothetical protein